MNNDTILSQRGRETFNHDSYVYVYEKSSKRDKSVKFWVCEQIGRCRARIHLRNGIVIKQINNHTHDPSAANVQVQQFISNLKRRAETTQEAAAQVINAISEKVHRDLLGNLPNTAALKKCIRQKRREILAPPPLPITLRELMIPESYKIYKAGDQQELFLVAERDIDDKKILVFGRQSWLPFLNADVWYADGTFSIAPTLFHQVYVISVKTHGGVLPVIYALLPNKRRATYNLLIAGNPPPFKIAKIQGCVSKNFTLGARFRK